MTDNCPHCSDETETEVRAWALWHPKHGFGSYLSVETYMDDAIGDRKARIKLDDDQEWKVVPVIVRKLTSSA